MGTHVVAARPLYPEPWPPESPKLQFVGGLVAYDVRTNCLSSLPPYTAQKWKFFTILFDILTIHNDKISHIKHVLDPLYVFFTPFGCLAGGTTSRPRRPML